jgi:lysophospholipid acyltransferase (LPLAT)-like uncharacterized protein
MKLSSKLIGWPVALAMLLLRATCRMRLHNDPRPALRAASEPYVYAVLHAHQVATAIDSERGTGAMVSQSADGEILQLGVRILGVKTFRGSSRSMTRDKGGRSALLELISHVLGGSPAYLSVDGPRGPRNRVHKGIAVLSKQTGAAVVNVVAIPRRRWIISGAWDRLQIPIPFCNIDAHFAEPIRPRQDEGVEEYRQRIECSLNQLERTWDPAEATST